MDDPEVAELVGLLSSLLRWWFRLAFCNKDVLEDQTGTEISFSGLRERLPFQV
jgi:hypothetical protein